MAGYDEGFSNVVFAVTSAIDDHGLTPREVEEACRDGIADSTAGDNRRVERKRKAKPKKEAKR